MKKSTKVILASLALLALIAGLAIYFARGRNQLETQVRETKGSPDGKWTAVVQMEVYSTSAFVDDAVYAVRLKGPGQKDRQGDLVMNVPVSYPKPGPSIDWRSGTLIVTLMDDQKYQYFASPVDGVSILVQQK
ncbi:MAG: hypothetical protein ACRD8A_17170 [Candidatus Acidiferrales bacterium]